MTGMALITFLSNSHGHSYGDTADSDALGLTPEEVDALAAAGLLSVADPAAEVAAEPAPKRGRQADVTAEAVAVEPTIVVD